MIYSTLEAIKADIEAKIPQFEGFGFVLIPGKEQEVKGLSDNYGDYFYLDLEERFISGSREVETTGVKNGHQFTITGKIVIWSCSYDCESIFNSFASCLAAYPGLSIDSFSLDPESVFFDEVEEGGEWTKDGVELVKIVFSVEKDFIPRINCNQLNCKSDVCI